MACASSMQKKGGFVIILFVLSLKQTMTIKEGIYIPTTLIQELHTRLTTSSVTKWWRWLSGGHS